MNKSEYIKHLKRLIRKYHPDLCTNSYLESMYNEITRILIIKLNQARSGVNSEKYEELNPEKIKEQDYAYYKLGVKYYRNIHPNKFYKRNTDSTFVTKTYKELISALNKIYLSFNLSEYYFRKVVDEYCQSPYFEDSKAKIKLLKKLYKSYENMVLEENKVINNEQYLSEMGLKIL